MLLEARLVREKDEGGGDIKLEFLSFVDQRAKISGGEGEGKKKEAG